MSENKLNYADFINWVPRENAKAGDILIYHENELKIIEANKYIPGICGEPIGVVYVGGKSMPDNFSRAISLRNMSVIFPTVGSLDEKPTNDIMMSWGKYSDILESYDGLPQLDRGFKPKSQLTYHGYISSSSIFPYVDNSSVNERRVQDLTNGKFYSHEGRSLENIFSDLENVIPSPDSMPKSYFFGATSDINGKRNTQFIVNQIDVDKILRDELFQEAINENNLELFLSLYPAFTSCFLFNPIGTNIGDWYLPSIGELGIFLSNLGEVNRTLGILEKLKKALRLCTDNMSCESLPEDVSQDSLPEDEGVLYYYNYIKYGSWLWSSTQYDSEYCWTINTLSCYISSESDKENTYDDFRVRASIMF